MRKVYFFFSHKPFFPIRRRDRLFQGHDLPSFPRMQPPFPLCAVEGRLSFLTSEGRIFEKIIRTGQLPLPLLPDVTTADFSPLEENEATTPSPGRPTLSLLPQ